MRLMTCLIILSFFGQVAFSQDKKAEKITYEEHVKPIFRQHCFSCHNQNKKEGDLDLTNYTSLMQGGGSGAVIEPGEVGDSYLFALVNHDEEPAMPPEQPKMAEAKVSLISKWIELGALENSSSKAMIKKKKSFDFALSDPAVGKPAVMPLPAKLDLEPVLHAKRATGVTAMATSPWAPITAIAGQKQVLLYDSKTRDLKGVLPFPEGIVSVLKFSRNGSLLLAGGGRGGAQGKVVVWNIKNGERIIEVGDELDTVLAADISSDQKLVALGGPQKMIRVYSTADNSLVYEIKKHTDWVTSLEFSPDGVLLCTGDRNGGVHVWEAFSGREYLTLKAHSKAVTGISWRSDSNIVATTSEDASIRLWEMNNGGQVKSWTAHSGGSLGVEFTRDGRLVSCGRDRTAKAWNQAGSRLFTFPAFADIAMGVTHCDETNTCFAGDWTGEIRQFNAADGKLVANVTSNPLPLSQKLAAAQQSHKTANQQVVQLTKAEMADRTAVEKTTAQIAETKKKMTVLTGLVSKLNPKMAADQKSLTTMNQEMAKAKTRLAALSLAIPEMKKAQTSASAASTKIPTDAELKKLAADIAKALTAKEAELKAKNTAVANFTAQIKTITTTINQDKVALTKHIADLAAAKQLLPKLEASLKPAQEKYAKSKAELAKGQATLAGAKANLDEVQSAVAFSKKFRELKQQVSVTNTEFETVALTHAELSAKTAEDQKTLSASQSAFAATKAKVDSQSAKIKTLDTKITELTNRTTAAKNEVAKLQTQLSQTQASMPHLDSARAKLDEASKAAPNDSDLSAALKSIVQLISKQTQKVTSIQTTIKTQTDALTKLANELQTVQQQKIAAMKTLGEYSILLTADQKQMESARQKATASQAAEAAAKQKVDQKQKEIDAVTAEIAKLQGI